MPKKYTREELLDIATVGLILWPDGTYGYVSRTQFKSGLKEPE